MTLPQRPSAVGRALGCAEREVTEQRVRVALKVLILFLSILLAGLQLMRAGGVS